MLRVKGLAFLLGQNSMGRGMSNLNPVPAANRNPRSRADRAQPHTLPQPV